MCFSSVSHHGLIIDKLVALHTHVVNVDPDVKSTLLETFTDVENRWFRVPLVADEDVSSTGLLAAAFYSRSINQSINQFNKSEGPEGH